MKAYTNIEQSKKLAEILPVESADMYYSSVPVRKWKDKEDKSKDTHVIFQDQIFALENLPNAQIGEEDTYAWSLAALLDVINDDYYTTLYHDGVAWNITAIHHDNVKDKHNVYANTPVDACVAMIELLHEQKLL